MLYFVELEAMDNVTRLWVLLEVRYRGIISKASQPRRSARVRGDMAKHVSARPQSEGNVAFLLTPMRTGVEAVSKSLLKRALRRLGRPKSGLQRVRLRSFLLA